MLAKNLLYAARVEALGPMGMNGKYVFLGFLESSGELYMTTSGCETPKELGRTHQERKNKGPNETGIHQEFLSFSIPEGIRFASVIIRTDPKMPVSTHCNYRIHELDLLEQNQVEEGMLEEIAKITPLR